VSVGVCEWGSGGMRERMLITGVSGLLGSNLAVYFRDKYDVLGLYNRHAVEIPGICTAGVDLLQPGAAGRVARGFLPDVVLHCASLANVDACEEDPELARRTNVLLVGEIAGCPELQAARFVYFSSDSVYDGVDGGFAEDGGIGPCNVYGASKRDGENQLDGRENTLILRTNLFGWNVQDKKSLGEWILAGLEEGSRVSAFADVRFSTIYTMELARALDVAVADGLSGTYNVGASDSVTKLEFATLIAERFGLDRDLVKAISIDDSSLKAPRGKDLSLDTRAFEEALLYRLPCVADSVEAFYRDFRCGFRERIGRESVAAGASSGLIRYGSQSVDRDDEDAVTEVLRSTNLTQGPKIEAFEAAVAERCGAKYAVAVSSGTAALHVSCLAAGVEAGCEVVTSPNTFVASANCAVYCGATPVFADIEADTYNMSRAALEQRFTGATGAVIPVAFAGQSCDMQAIRDAVDAAAGAGGRDVCVIEDASHALGSRYRDANVGACVYSDMTVFSFHPVKHITTGEGGMVLTNDELLHRRLRRFRSHGITSIRSELLASEPPSRGYYEQQELGYNYRITDLQCALGLSQLRKLPTFMARRRSIVDAYNRAFDGCSKLRVPYESPLCATNFHLYVLQIDFEAIGMRRDDLMGQLLDRGVQTQVHYIPVHTQPFYRERFGTGWGDCPVAESYYKRCLSIPLHPRMGDDDVNKVIDAVKALTGEQ